MDIDERRTPDAELGPILARGRDAVIHDAGPGLVLRRTPGPRDLRAESELMEHLRVRGYPVPRVVRTGPGEQVLERVDGPTMLAVLEARPWRAKPLARQLAALHRDLHEIEPPSWLPPHRVDGSAIVHLDLHPGNVICSTRGPVVIDWGNARRARPEVDVATTWLLMGAFEHDPTPITGPWHRRLVTWTGRRVEPVVRRRVVEAFLAATALREPTRAVLAATAEERLEDRNVRPGEAAAIAALVAEHAR